jgi:hypothetical protein
MKQLKEQWAVILVIFILAIIAGIIGNLIVKQVPVTADGKAIPGGQAYKSSLGIPKAPGAVK